MVARDPVSRTVKYIFLAMDIWVTSLTAMDPEDWEQLSAQNFEDARDVSLTQDKSKVRIYRQGTLSFSSG